MRIAITGLIGAIVMFIWGAVAHMALPIGEAGMKLQRHPRRPDSAPAIRMTIKFGISKAPDSWRDYLYWNVELDEES